MLLPDPTARWTLRPPALWRERIVAILAGPASVPGARDGRIDMFRGLALLMIFVNHVPGTLYENWTSRNFGFSDAAEAFVFISGLAAGLAYTNRLEAGAVWPGTVKILARARQIYFVHLVVTLVVLAIFAGVAMGLGRPEVLAMHGIRLLFEHPLQAMIGLPLLTYQLGYVNILPLYIVLLLATPALILAGRRWPLALLAGSILLWAAAAQFKVNFPSYPGGGGWFLNPLSWQLIFVVGLLCGIAQRQGRLFVPRSRVLFWVAAAFVVLVLLWVRIPELGDLGRRGLGRLSSLGVPGYLVWFEKPYLFLPRLLHALALFYVLANLGIVRWFAESRWAEPLRVLGRSSLPVFAAGSVLSLGLQALRWGLEADPIADGLALAGGMILLLALAQMLAAVRGNPQTPRMQG